MGKDSGALGTLDWVICGISNQSNTFCVERIHVKIGNKSTESVPKQARHHHDAHFISTNSWVSAAALLISKMGKKSKRRAGSGGTAKASGGGGDDQPLVPHEALLQVTAPKSLKGIFSTNDEPTRCIFCSKCVILGQTYYLQCCGKICCRNCPKFIVDICGKSSCASCNALSTESLPILQRQAGWGKVWAQHMLGHYFWRINQIADARNLFIQSALKGNFDSFLSLSRMYCEGKGVSRDLKLSEAFARKARALYADCGLLSNQMLFDIAIIYSDIGALNQANDILFGIMHEADESALDACLCDGVAIKLEEYPHLAAEMYARAFCYGNIESIESATEAFLNFIICEKLALSKLWLDVACKTKTLFEISLARYGARTISWQRNEGIESGFDPISAKCATHAAGVGLLFLEKCASTAVAAVRTAIATRSVRSSIKRPPGGMQEGGGAYAQYSSRDSAWKI